MRVNVINFIPVINHNYRTMFKKDLFSVEELGYITKISEERKRIITTSLSSQPLDFFGRPLTSHGEE